MKLLTVKGVQKEIMENIELGVQKFYKQFKSVVDKSKNHIIPLGKEVRSNWSCIFNNLENQGRLGILIATDDKVCVVAFEDKPEIYRCEDLDVEV